MIRRLALLGLLALVVLAASAIAAQAGQWVQVACVNPDGSASTNQGWSGFATGSPGVWPYTDVRCGPGKPLTADLSAQAAVPGGSYEVLQYTPPAGSMLTGGTLDVNIAADGYNSGTAINTVALVRLYEPAYVDSPSDNFYQCVAWLATCPGTNTVNYTGTVALPAAAGGDVFASAGCDGTSQCDTNAQQGAWALAQISWAHFLLASDVSPGGTDFGGSALQPRAHGTAHLVFTASDPGGPGVYAVTISIDGRPVWSGVPDANDGACAPVGTDPSGALMFDSQQPCLTSEAVDVPVPTSGLPDGSHALTATVTDAAQNASSVLDQTIDTFNPQTTPAPRSGLRATFVISWRWLGRYTVLRSITARRVPARARVSVRCVGAGCPKLKVTSVAGRRIKRLLRGLAGKRMRTGDKLLITVSEPGRRGERIELVVRDNRKPLARLLRH